MRLWLHIKPPVIIKKIKEQFDTAELENDSGDLYLTEVTTSYIVTNTFTHLS